MHILNPSDGHFEKRYEKHNQLKIWLHNLMIKWQIAGVLWALDLNGQQARS